VRIQPTNGGGITHSETSLPAGGAILVAQRTNDLILGARHGKLRLMVGCARWHGELIAECGSPGQVLAAQ
jgi:hypothetical protein